MGEFVSKRNPTRRKILMAGAGASAMVASARLAAQTAEGQPIVGNPALPDDPAKRLGWAIVGLGTFAIGQVIPGFADARRSRITAFVSGNPEKGRMLGARYGVERLYSYDDFDSIADDPAIDCVYIVLPVGLHAEYTIRALKAGKHVLCEKPMASTSAEAEAMIAAAEAAQRKLGVAYRVHFEPNNAHVLDRVGKGDLGKMRLVTADHGFSANPDYPPHKWRLEKLLAGGGSLWDIGVYGINTSLMMLPGDRVPSVSAAYATPRGDPRFSEVEGAIDYRLRASGINVQGSSSYCYSPYVSRQRYFGSEASIEMQPATTYYDNEIRFEGGGQPPRIYRAGIPGSSSRRRSTGLPAPSAAKSKCARRVRWACATCGSWRRAMPARTAAVPWSRQTFRSRSAAHASDRPGFSGCIEACRLRWHVSYALRRARVRATCRHPDLQKDRGGECVARSDRCDRG